LIGGVGQRGGWSFFDDLSSTDDVGQCFELKQAEQFRRWRTRLTDERARALIASRLDCVAYGYAGATRRRPNNPHIAVMPPSTNSSAPVT
jgi:hypothetical protein